MKRRLGHLLLGIAVVWVGACAQIPGSEQRLQKIEQQAAAHGWQRLDIGAPPFVLTAWLPQSPERSQAPAGKVLTVYIEGDGLAWITRSRPSTDPTPVDPIGFNLALRHPDGAVAYLARPCQYTASGSSAGCAAKYWTSHRFASEVVAATSRALTELKKTTGAETLRLIGYSGGGAIAALVAAERSDVGALITLAGNLDHARWTEYHGVEPLRGSLNPVTVATALASVPQLHFVGRQDAVIPHEIAESFVASQGAVHCSAIAAVDHADHRHGWIEAWPGLLAEPLPCR